MAPLTWKLLLATATLASGQHCSATDSCEDQTALLQSHLASHKSSLATAESAHMLNFPKMTTLADPTKRKMALAQFEQTAMDLATSGTAVTDEVAEICNVTTELLRSTVLQAILNEHDTDVAMLAAAHHAFDPIENQRANYEIEIDNVILPVYGDGGLVEEHITCRNTEASLCVECGTCEVECEEDTERCTNNGQRLEELHNDVINIVTLPAQCAGDPPHIVPPSSTRYAAEVSMADHQNNKEAMEAYLAELALYVPCVDPPPTWICNTCPPNPDCTVHPDTPCCQHQNAIRECDVVQNSLQAQACQARYTVANYLELYRAAFQAVEVRYNQVRTSIMLSEADRKVEWDTLERVICLLGTLVQTEDGATASTENRERIQGCENDAIPEGGIGTDHLTIDYPAVPNIGTLPSLPESPCSQEFQDHFYENITAPCGGIVDFQERYDHGFVDVCECNADDPPPIRTGFPYELGPFLLFDTGLELNSATGFTANIAGLQWQATYDGSLYTGTLSPFKPVTIPGLDDAFGLSGEGTDSAVQVAWAYPNADASAAATARIEAEGENQAHRFFRTGGYVYLNTASEVVALKEVAVTDHATEEHQMSFVFAPPAEITEAEANSACPGGMHPITIASIRNNGGDEYCWDKSGTLTVSGPHGAFLYKVVIYDNFTEITTTRWLAFALLAGSLPNAPPHYPATDQQNADEHSMSVRYLAHGLVDHPIPDDRIGTPTDKAMREGTNWMQLAGME